jgi:hypothetical protein
MEGAIIRDHAALRGGVEAVRRDARVTGHLESRGKQAEGSGVEGSVAQRPDDAPSRRRWARRPGRRSWQAQEAEGDNGKNNGCDGEHAESEEHQPPRDLCLRGGCHGDPSVQGPRRGGLATLHFSEIIGGLLPPIPRRVQAHPQTGTTSSGVWGWWLGLGS